MESRLELQVFGGVEVRRPDGSMVQNWVRPTGRRLLCLLLLSPGRSLARTQLADSLFPEAGTGAANALAKAIHWCRAALGEPWQQGLRAEGGMVRWEGPAWTDADAVLACARGKVPLTDLQSLRDAYLEDRELLPGWDAGWVEDLRDEVQGGRAAIRRTLAQSLLGGSASEVGEALPLWENLVKDDPLDQDHHIGLLRALFALGRDDEARQAWLECRRVLWAELKAVPSPELEEVWFTHGAAAESARRNRRAASNRTLPSEALVGRTEELAQMVRWLETAGHGSGGCVTVLGPAGSGKSTLLAAGAAHFRGQGWQVAEVAATGDATRPYGAALGLLRQLLPNASDPSGLEVLLAADSDGAAPATRQDRRDTARHLAVARLLDQHVTIPSVLIVDDLHDTDPASARLIRSLATTQRRRWWSLAVTTRTANVAVPKSHLLSVGPLPAQDLEVIITARLPGVTPAQVQVAATRSLGNPLFALEIAGLLLARHDPTSVPPTAIELLRERLRRLPATERLLMPLVVIASHDATWPVLRESVHHLEQDRLSDAQIRHALDLLHTEDLVHHHGERLVASHPLIGEAALTLLSRSGKAALHDAVGDALLAIDPKSDTAAQHRVAAFDLVPGADRAATAGEAALQAARTALSQGRNPEAADMARCVERAWVATPPGSRASMRDLRSEALLILGHALAHTSQAESSAAYDMGVRTAADDEARARFHLAEGWMHYMHGDLSRAARTYTLGLDLAAVTPTQRAFLSVHLGWVLARQGLHERGLALCDRALQLLGTDADPAVLGTALDRRAMILAFLGNLDAARGEADHAFEVAVSSGDLALLSAVQSHRGNIQGRLGHWEPALRYLDDAVLLARRIGDAYLESIAWWSRTDVLTRKGDLEGALAANQAEIHALELTGNSVHLAACHRRRRRLSGRDELPEAQTEGPTP